MDVVFAICDANLAIVSVAVAAFVRIVPRPVAQILVAVGLFLLLFDS